MMLQLHEPIHQYTNLLTAHFLSIYDNSLLWLYQDSVRSNLVEVPKVDIKNREIDHLSDRKQLLYKIKQLCLTLCEYQEKCQPNIVMKLA